MGAVMHAGYDLANAINPPNLSLAEIGALPNQVDPRGLLTFGVAGSSFVIVAWLIRRDPLFPRGLGTLGYVLAFLFVVLYLGRLTILSPTHPVILVSALLSGFLVGPAWYGGLGVVLQTALPSRFGRRLAARTIPWSFHITLPGVGQGAWNSAPPAGAVPMVTRFGRDRRPTPAARAAALGIVLAALGLPCAAVTLAAGGTLNLPLIERVIADHDVPSTSAERALSPLAADPDRVLYLVRPAETDPGIDHFLKDHYVMYNRGVPQNGKLFLFLPGTWASPRSYQVVLDEAARAGYKAVGLEYPDDTPDPGASAVGQICRRDPDPACAARVRQARVTGGSAGSEVSVTRPNSIENRLAKLLAFLGREHPSDGWGAYLTGNSVNWTRVAVAGHSQGAGMAAFIGKQHIVARVALWSGPADYVLATHSLAPWISGPSATPAALWYGMIHQDEPGAQRLLAAYSALGIPGQPVVASADVLAGAHQFIATLPPQPGVAAGPFGAAHSSIVVDRLTPRAQDGRPAYTRVWDAMIGR
jgi:hypothetical protein